MARLLHIAGVESKVPALAANSIQVMRMADAFAALGHEVTLVVPHGRGALGAAAAGMPAARRAAGASSSAGGEIDPYAFYGVRPRFQIHRVWTPGGGGRAGTLAFAAQARALAQRTNWDRVFCRHALATVLLARAGITHIYEAHHFRVAGTVDRWLLAALRTPYVARLVLLAEALALPFAAQGIPPEKMLVAPDAGPVPDANAVVTAAEREHARRFLGAAPGEILCVYAGSLGALKGTDHLLAAAALLPGVRFAVVGGVPGASAPRRAETLPNVRLTGPVAPSAVPPLLTAADCLVLPHAAASATRHLSPLKIFEYLAAGRAIVATDLPATRGILADQMNALVVPPDDPARLAAAIARATGDAALNARLGAAAAASAREHTWEKRAARILADLPATPPAPGALRVAHILSSFHPLVGGAERQAEALATMQAARGHSVLVLTRRRPGLSALDGRGPVAIHRVPVGPFGGLGFFASGLAFLHARRRRLDLVHAHQARANAVLAYAARRLGGPPLVVKLAGLDLPRGRDLSSALRRGLLRRADAVVALTPAMRDALRTLGVPASRLHLIPNGVDRARFAPADEAARHAARAALGLPAAPPLVVFVGRLETVKGADLLVAAWAQVAAPAAVLALVGAGPLAAELARACRGNEGPLARVRFAGAVADTAPWYRAADLAVVPSRSEGLANSLIEAMASGLALVATAVPGNAAVISDGLNGRLVPPEPRALARAIDELLAAPAERLRLGSAAARTAAERYDLRVTADSYETLYRTLIAGR
jgi:glycosyltransferase involved in cell wall biosynthesis